VLKQNPFLTNASITDLCHFSLKNICNTSGTAQTVLSSH